MPPSPPMICRKCGGPMVLSGLSAASVAPTRSLEQTRTRTTMIATPTSTFNGEKIKPAPRAARPACAKPTPRSPLYRIQRHHRPASPRPRQPPCSRPSPLTVSRPIEARPPQSAPAESNALGRVTRFAKRLALNTDLPSGSYLAERQILNSWPLLQRQATPPPEQPDHVPCSAKQLIRLVRIV